MLILDIATLCLILASNRRVSLLFVLLTIAQHWCCAYLVAAPAAYE